MIERIVANGHGSLSPKYLAVHSTANPGAPAINHVNLWKRDPKYAVHAVSDWKEAYHTVPWDRLCYQVGNGNKTCIGIEICEATNEADFMRGMEIARAAIWEMLNMKGWNVDQHVRSHDWFRINYGGTDHTDPLPYLRKFGKDWNWFINFLKEDDDMTPDQSNKLNTIFDVVTATSDPTGRNVIMNDHDHIKWIAKVQSEQGEKLNKIVSILEKIEKKL